MVYAILRCETTADEQALVQHRLAFISWTCTLALPIWCCCSEGAEPNTGDESSDDQLAEGERRTLDDRAHGVDTGGTKHDGLLPAQRCV